MPNYTKTLKLEKPLQTESYNIDVHNANSDKLDKAIGISIQKIVNTNHDATLEVIRGDGTSTSVTVDKVEHDVQGTEITSYVNDITSKDDTLTITKGNGKATSIRLDLTKKANLIDGKVPLSELPELSNIELREY